MQAHPTMQQFSAHFCVDLMALLTVQSSMEQTQPTQTYSTLLTLLRLAQQETLSLCLQLVEMSL